MVQWKMAPCWKATHLGDTPLAIEVSGNQDTSQSLSKLWEKNQVEMFSHFKKSPFIQEISNRTHVSRTPKKPWVSNSSNAAYWTGSVGIRSHSIFDVPLERHHLSTETIICSWVKCLFVMAWNLGALSGSIMKSHWCKKPKSFRHLLITYKWYISGMTYLPIGGWTMPPIPPFTGTKKTTIDSRLSFGLSRADVLFTKPGACSSKSRN